MVGWEYKLMSKETTMESVLIKAAGILDQHKIQHWVTDGTLLGLIRENKILPWDTDIDLAVFKKDVSVPNLIMIFINEGFEYLEVLPEVDSLHFRIDNVQLDINLYTEKSGKTSIKWATNPVGLLDRIIVQSINKMFEGRKKIDIPSTETSRVVGLFKIFLSSFGRILSDDFLEKIFTYARSKYLYLGSQYPSELIEMKKFNFKGYTINVPINSDEYLRLTYGDDWKTPKKDFVWETDVRNLTVFDHKNK
tara:strand:+ start:349 stop:1098 length:750 start_codon:yes stop_codon:yes gene_type:complete